MLAMQVLGGEPQAAYLLGVAGLGYAAGLAWSRERSRKTNLAGAGTGHSTLGLSLLAATVAVILWWAVSLALARWLPGLRGPGNPPPPFRWTSWVPLGVVAAWGLVAVGFLVRWRLRAGAIRWASPGSGWLARRLWPPQ